MFKPFIKYPVACKYMFKDGVSYCMFTDGVLLKYVGGILDEQVLYPADHCLNDSGTDLVAVTGDCEELDEHDDE